MMASGDYFDDTRFVEAILGLPLDFVLAPSAFAAGLADAAGDDPLNMPAWSSRSAWSTHPLM